MNELIETLADYIVDNMDTKSMERFIYETLLESYSVWENKELVEHIDSVYGPEWFENNGVKRPEL